MLSARGGMLLESIRRLGGCTGFSCYTGKKVAEDGEQVRRQPAQGNQKNCIGKRCAKKVVRVVFAGKSAGKLVLWDILGYQLKEQLSRKTARAWL